MTRFTLVLIASTALDAALAAAALGWAIRSRRRQLLRAAAAVALTVVVAAAKLVALALLGVRDSLALAHFVYLDLVVAVPLAGAAVLLLARRRRRDDGTTRLGRPAALVAAGALLLAPVGVYATYVEPNTLRVERARVPLAPERAGEQPVAVGVLADIQTDEAGDHERTAVARLMRERPDVILIPGDVFQAHPERLREQLPGLQRLFAGLDAPGGVFFVMGDQDVPEETGAIFAGTKVRTLFNEVARVRVRDRRLTIAGVELSHGTPAALAAARALEQARGDGDVRILLSHRPDTVLARRPGTRVDLVVAGHTHGGQVQLPLFGAPHTASGVPRAVGSGGLHDLGGGRRIYVSRGVGLERGEAPRLRFLAPPEVSVLTLADVP